MLTISSPTCRDLSLELDDFFFENLNYTIDGAVYEIFENS